VFVEIVAWKSLFINQAVFGSSIELFLLRHRLGCSRSSRFSDHAKYSEFLQMFIDGTIMSNL